MMKKVLLLITALVSATLGFQDSKDSLLFKIDLNNDSNSLYNCVWDDHLRSSLAGPVLMAENTLLFYSKHGYVLYNTKGKFLEKHSLIKDNRKAAQKGEPLTILAYPFDSTSVIYYRDSEKKGEPPLIFRKKLFKRKLRKLKGDERKLFKEIKKFRPLNISRNSISEDVGRTEYLKPHLAGFTSLDDDSRNWWTTDMFYSFTSPLIVEEDGEFVSFFPGLKSGGHCDVPLKLIEPMGVFSREGRWYYLGIYNVMGNKKDEYHQTVILCDQAGNVLYCNELLKQEITDAVLQEVRKIETVFTVRKAGTHVFVPSVDPYGDMYYGAINWEWKEINVYKRSFIRFLPVACASVFGNQFAEEGRVSFIPVKVDCSNASRKGIIPEVVYKDKEDGMLLLDKKDLARDSLYVKVHRLPDNKLKKKLSRVPQTMPPEIGAMQESIAKLPTTWCPYGISLNHIEKGTLSNLDYGFGDVVVCARVLGKSKSGNVFIRVDLENWAEVVVLSSDGQFRERFTFNNLHHEERKDITILSPKGVVYEKDYEAGKNKAHRFLKWDRDIRPLYGVVKRK
ncbi:MAG: hypothetical protein ACLFQB_06065 [Chitinispirillaceae bacterium]